MSCMENPQTFLRQLRDYDLLQEDSYQKVSRMQSIKKIKNGLYEILDRLESKQPQDIQKFWSCVFKETIMNEYPTLRLLRNDLKNASPLKKGEKNDIWNWDLYKSQLPVTCGEKEGILSRQRLANDEEGEREEQTDASHDTGRKVFKVTCRLLAGTLHEKRFATGTLGKSIRTATRWMTPMQFMQEACPTYLSWKKDIECEGKALGDHIKANILRIHKVPCDCTLCKPGSKDLDDEKNDDECFICKTEEEEEFVVCDTCPRSFHQKCHLPHVEDKIIGADKDQVFASNPCGLERYSSVIKTPMWLDNVAGKLQKKLYQTVGEFVSDVQLIFSNSASYNQGNAGYLAMGNRLKELFDKEFNSVFNISEQTVG
ncbi:Nuclear body protein SP140-like protein [Dissostichus eleginoides]|uniref:Nuclear body protein SP140-like protein n=1 Tax=Dissostichus eleginoides TaxID=100907 RepID=A0AAD9B5X0_DISEL|nr:Nuclear body protein SP140-like protein [Dissostichus eleginoides]